MGKAESGGVGTLGNSENTLTERGCECLDFSGARTGTVK